MKKEKVNNQKNTRSKSKKGPWIFMIISILLFGIASLFNHTKSMEAIHYLYHLIIEIFPVLLVVFVLMVLINLFLKPQILIKHMGKESGLKGWIIAIIAGILSVGAIYMWFPLLKEMIDKGIKPGLVAVFLYNRGIKIHWLPLMGLYFGLNYVIILTLVTVLVSILQGLIIDWLLGRDSSQAVD